jgi:hypothetical protein
MSGREVLELFFSHIVKSTSMEWKLKHINEYISALKNYFMMTIVADISIM